MSQVAAASATDSSATAGYPAPIAVGIIAATKKRNRRKTVYQATHLDHNYQTLSVVTATAGIGGDGDNGIKSMPNKNNNSIRRGSLATEQRQPSQPNRIGGGRLKKARVLFDPSEENFPRRRRTTTCEPMLNNADAKQPEQPQEVEQQPKKLKTSKPTKTRNSVDNAVGCASSSNAADMRHASVSNGQVVSDAPRRVSERLATCGICETDDSIPDDNDEPATVSYNVCTQCKRQRVHTECYKRVSFNYSAKEATNWQCDTCQTCSQCYESFIIGTVFKCYTCHLYYHAECNHVADRPISEPLDVQSMNRISCARCLDFTGRNLHLELQKIAVTYQMNVQEQVEQQRRLQSQEQSQRAKTTEHSVAKDKQQPPNAEGPRLKSTVKRSSGFAGFSETEVQRLHRSPVEVANGQQAKRLEHAETPDISSNGYNSGDETLSPPQVASPSMNHSSAISTAAVLAVPIMAAKPIVSLPSPSRSPPNNEYLLTNRDVSIEEKNTNAAAAGNVAIISDAGADEQNAVEINLDAHAVAAVAGNVVIVLDAVDDEQHNAAKFDKTVNAVAAAPAGNHELSAAEQLAAIVANGDDIIDVLPVTPTISRPAAFVRWWPYGSAADSEQIDPIPDVSHWTIEDVFEYFARFFDDRDVQTLITHEIDGAALMLLSRKDVLNFRSVMGVKLRMYAHVMRFQIRSNDLRFCFATDRIGQIDLRE